MNHTKQFFLLLLLTACSAATCGQASLSKKISMEVNRQRLDNVLEILSNKAGFYFSYNSSVIKKDSLVSISVANKTIQEVLQLLFSNSCEFRESGNYIIIRRAPLKMTLVTQQGKTEDKIYAVSGFVYDDQTGDAINEASIYEKNLLASALSNTQGFFKLKLKSHRGGTAALTVSKTDYEDTTVVIKTRMNQQLTVTLVPLEQASENIIVQPRDSIATDTPAASGMALPDEKPAAPKGDSLKVEKSGWAKLILSGKQKVQSLNLNKFFTTRPFQVSLTPAIGSHGHMSAQVVNNFSLNILGGYTAGTNGLEIAGLFNIDKKEVKYFQAAGVFNAAGGPVKGFQAAGVTNWVLDSTKAFQAAGVNNYVKGKLAGAQVAGVYNHVTGNARGIQVAGVANFTGNSSRGLQVGGVVNISRQQMEGVQIAGILNYTKKLKGLQIGLINIADSSEGYSIGLINIVKKGYHQLVLSSNETIQLNAAYKSGNPALYSILLGGVSTGSNNRLYSYGYGLGSDLPLNKKKNISLQATLSSQYLYLGSWDYTNILNRATLSLGVSLGKYITLFAGPSYSVYITDQTAGISGYRFPVVPAGYNTHVYSNKVSGWLGWNAGISIF